MSKKLINITWSLEFNSVCLKENILPNYTRIRHHDPAVRKTTSTVNYRRYLIEREIRLKERDHTKYCNQRDLILTQIEEYQGDDQSRVSINTALKSILENSDKVQKTKTLKKLNNLYRGPLMNKENVDCYINLSSYDLTEDEKDFLNLGLNYHLQPKYDKLHKAAEMEILYSKLTELEKSNTISINPSIVSLLTTESNKHRNPKYISSVTPKLRNAAKNLRENEDLTIKKADKSAIYVLLNKDDYMNKLNSILSDSTKFQKVEKDPTPNLKKEANELISALNAEKK